MTLRRIVVETPCEHDELAKHLLWESRHGLDGDCPGGTIEDRTVVSPEAIEAAARALGEVLLIPDPTNTEKTTLIMDATEAAIRAFITVQYGIEENHDPAD